MPCQVFCFPFFSLIYLLIKEEIERESRTTLGTRYRKLFLTGEVGWMEKRN